MSASPTNTAVQQLVLNTSFAVSGETGPLLSSLVRFAAGPPWRRVSGDTAPLRIVLVDDGGTVPLTPRRVILATGNTLHLYAKRAASDTDLALELDFTQEGADGAEYYEANPGTLAVNNDVFNGEGECLLQVDFVEHDSGGEILRSWRTGLYLLRSTVGGSVSAPTYFVSYSVQSPTAPQQAQALANLGIPGTTGDGDGGLVSAAFTTSGATNRIAITNAALIARNSSGATSATLDTETGKLTLTNGGATGDTQSWVDGSLGEVASMSTGGTLTLRGGISAAQGAFTVGTDGTLTVTNANATNAGITNATITNAGIETASIGTAYVNVLLLETDGSISQGGYTFTMGGNVSFGATGRALAAAAAPADARSTIGLVIGTDVQAQSASLSTLSAVTPGTTGLVLIAATTAIAARANLGVLRVSNIALDSATWTAATISGSAPSANGASSGGRFIQITGAATSFARSVFSVSNGQNYLQGSRTQVNFSRSWRVSIRAAIAVGPNAASRATFHVSGPATPTAHDLTQKGQAIQFYGDGASGAVVRIQHYHESTLTNSSTAVFPVFSDEFYDLELVWLTGVGLYLYVDGVLTCSLTSGLPSGLGTAASTSPAMLAEGTAATANGAVFRIGTLVFGTL